MTEADVRQLHDMLTAVNTRLSNMEGQLAQALHVAGQCELNERVKTLEEARAKASGFLSAVHIGLGTLAGLGGGGLVWVLERLVGR